MHGRLKTSYNDFFLCRFIKSIQDIFIVLYEFNMKTTTFVLPFTVFQIVEVKYIIIFVSDSLSLLNNPLPSYACAAKAGALEQAVQVQKT